MLIAGFAVELPDRWMTTITITLTLMCGATAAAAYGNYYCPLLDIGPKVRRKTGPALSASSSIPATPDYRFILLKAYRKYAFR